MGLRKDTTYLQFKDAPANTVLGWDGANHAFHMGAFTPATDLLDGKVGLVPAPLGGQQAYVLGNTGWVPSAGSYPDLIEDIVIEGDGYDFHLGTSGSPLGSFVVNSDVIDLGFVDGSLSGKVLIGPANISTRIINAAVIDTALTVAADSLTLFTKNLVDNNNITVTVSPTELSTTILEPSTNGEMSLWHDVTGWSWYRYDDDGGADMGVTMPGGISMNWYIYDGASASINGDSTSLSSTHYKYIKLAVDPVTIPTSLNIKENYWEFIVGSEGVPLNMVKFGLEAPEYFTSSTSRIYRFADNYTYVLSTASHFLGVLIEGVVRFSTTFNPFVAAVDAVFTKNLKDSDKLPGSEKPNRLAFNSSDNSIFCIGATTNPIFKLDNQGMFVPGFAVGAIAGGSPICGVYQPTKGAVVIGGSFNSYSSTTVGGIVRLIQTNATIDSTFTSGTGIDLGAGQSIQDMYMFSDESILILGKFHSYNSNACFGIAKISANGVFDATFNTAGSGFNVDAGHYAGVAAIQSDGKIIVGGVFTTYNGTTTPANLIRLNANGTKDTGFVCPAFNTSVEGISIQSDGKIIVVGTFTTAGGTARRIVRLNTDGTKDTTFAAGEAFNTSATGVIIDPSSNILVVGQFGSYKGGSDGKPSKYFVAIDPLANRISHSPVIRSNRTINYESNITLASLTDASLITKGQLNEVLADFSTGPSYTIGSGLTDNEGTVDFGSTIPVTSDIYLSGGGLVGETDGKYLLIGGFGSSGYLFGEVHITTQMGTYINCPTLNVGDAGTSIQTWLNSNSKYYSEIEVYSDRVIIAGSVDTVDNATVTTALRLQRRNSGTSPSGQAAGAGVRLEFALETSLNNNFGSGAGITYVWNTATNAAMVGRFDFHLHAASATATKIVELDRYGFKYAADYSADYTDRSLVDRGYVLAATLRRGYNATMNSTTFDMNSFEPFLVQFQSAASWLKAGDGNKVDIVVTGATENSKIITTESLITLARTNSVPQTTKLEIGGIALGGSTIGNILVTGIAGNFEGIKYAADYSAQYTSRSLVDKAYVLSVAGGAAYPDLVANTTVDGANNYGFHLENLVNFSVLIIDTPSTDEGSIDIGNTWMEFTIDAPNGYMAFDNSTDDSTLDFYGGNQTQLLLGGPTGLVSLGKNGPTGFAGALVIDGSNSLIELMRTTVTSQVTKIAIGGSEIGTTNVGNIVVTGIAGDFQGIRYAADYSAQYTSRSLVDKAYVLSVAGGMTNTAIAGEFPKVASSTSLVPSGIFSGGDGNISLGSSSLTGVGGRVILCVSSDASCPIAITPKGSGQLYLNFTFGALLLGDAAVAGSRTALVGSSDTNADFTLTAKGNGNITFNITSTGKLQVGGTGSAGGRTIAVSSSDTDANLTLAAKGNGNIIFDITSTGIIQLGATTVAGTTRKIQPQGSSAAISLYLHAKGSSGHVELGVGGTGILYLGDNAQSGSRTIMIGSSDTNAGAIIAQKGTGTIQLGIATGYLNFIANTMQLSFGSTLYIGDAGVAGARTLTTQSLDTNADLTIAQKAAGVLTLGGSPGTARVLGTLFQIFGNIGLFGAGAGSVGGGVGVLAMTNAGTIPTSNHAGGGILFVEGGALKFRGASGTVTTIAPA